MKLRFDKKNKKAELDIDAERLIEKGMDQHDKNWKDKFNTKHSAKKEMLEMKHKQKLEIEEKNEKKKNWFQKIEEERRKTRLLEIEEERRKEEERKKKTKIKIIATIIIAVCGLVLMTIGMILTTKYPDTPYGLLMVLGLMSILAIIGIWTYEEENNKKRRR